eukprot:2147454-Lingulodinium_polyedra.AAC.1
MMRSNRTSAVAAGRNSHASRTPWCSHGVCEACDLRADVAAPKQHLSSARAAPAAVLEQHAG